MKSMVCRHRGKRKNAVFPAFPVEFPRTGIGAGKKPPPLGGGFLPDPFSPPVSGGQK